MKTTASVLSLLMLFFSSVARADIFGTGANTFQIEFVAIGNLGNPPDAEDGDAVLPGTQNFGSVTYAYRIGKHEVSEQMIEKANVLGGLSITKDARGPNKPATSVSWFEAAQFVNWLNTSSGSALAYKFDAVGNFQLWQSGDAGYNPNNPYRNKRATYFLPSDDEWYKAAYHDATAGPGGTYFDYPTGSNAVPDGIDFTGDTNFDAVFDDGISGNFNPEPNDITDVGILSPYGTAGQGANVWEWEESDSDLMNDLTSYGRASRGGDWYSNSDILLPSYRNNNPAELGSDNIGFRVASVIPEPPSLVLVAVGILGLVVRRSGH